MLVNTGLHRQDEPMVHTAAQAIELLKNSPLDFIIIQQTLVRKRTLSKTIQEEA